MTVLVTGGAGYIGSHTCLELLQAGHDIVVVDNLVNADIRALDRVAALAGRAPAFYELDVRDEAALEELFQEHHFDCVIHFAGLKAVGESVYQPLRYYENNLGSTLALCKVMARHGCKRLVFSSSATVYSAGSEMPLTESSPTGGCTNPYGWTKYLCERILTDLAHADPDWSVVLLRYFNPVGAHESGQLGEDPRGIPDNLMPYLTKVAVGQLDHLNIFGNDYPTPDGTGVRDYLHVVDLAKGHIAALGHLMEHRGTEAFNLGTGRGYSVLDMVHAFERANGLKIPFQIAPHRPGDVAVCYADPRKSERVLGWRAERDLEQMCRDSYRWQRQNPGGYAGGG